MIPTVPRLARGPGFLKRTTTELSRLSRLAYNMEMMNVPSKPHYLLDFEQDYTVEGCKTMADRAVGGYSTANLDYVPADPSTGSPAHARFHGTISTKLPPNWRVQRTGYAAFRNKDRGMWLFGRLFWDMDPYAYLALRVKSDGRRYTVNVQTDSIVESDIHQHRLFTSHHRLDRQASNNSPISSSVITPSEASSKSPSESPKTSEIPAALADFPAEEGSGAVEKGADTSSYTTTPNPNSSGWETILIKWNDFVRTNHGMVIEPQTGMVRQRVMSVGIGLTDRVEGPYDLRIHRMWASNGLSKEEMEEEKRLCGSEALTPSASEAGEDPPLLVDSEAKGVDRFKDLKGFKKQGK